MPKILIIEDDPLIIKIYTTRLTADGYQVLSAENGQDGLKLALAEIPDLILLDIMMPKIDGFGVIQKLKTEDRLKDKPILAYTNLSLEDEIKRAKDLGVSEYIIKANVSPTEIVEKIKSYLPLPPKTPAPAPPPSSQSG